MIEQILSMHKQGVSIRKISRALDLSRNTIRAYLREAVKPVVEASPAVEQTGPSRWDLNFPWELAISLRKRGVTHKQIYAELSPTISYSRFSRVLSERCKPTQRPTVRLDHEPAQRVQIDFCDGPSIIDARTGKLRKTYLFCAVFPFSSYTYAEFTFDQKLSTFISCHQRMWAFFGGISPYVVIDNLKSGVKSAHRYDPDLNPTYCDYGNHCGFSVLPARPYTPRDKACIEATIGVFQRSLYQSIREEVFYDLWQLNDRCKNYVIELNSSVMKDYGISREERFKTEYPLLQPLVGQDYEISEWKTVKVHRDSCVQIDKCLYSVPYRYIGQSLKAKITAGMVEIFNADLSSIACHKKLKSVGASSVLEDHLPSDLQQSQSFDIRKAMAQAEAIGPKTAELVAILFSDTRPLKHLRRVLGILRLHGGGVPVKAMEYAAAQALCFHRHELKYFKSCTAAYKESDGVVRPILPRRDLDTIHLHGER